LETLTSNSPILGCFSGSSSTQSNPSNSLFYTTSTGYKSFTLLSSTHFLYSPSPTATTSLALSITPIMFTDSNSLIKHLAQCLLPVHQLQIHCPKCRNITSCVTIPLASLLQDIHEALWFAVGTYVILMLVRTHWITN